MNRIAKYFIGFALAAGIGHITTILAAPRVIMNTAIKRIAGPEGKFNTFQFGSRTTEKSRGVVRPSPDLAYSSCVYDLSGGPILVEAAPSPDRGYMSISVFDARTDNIAVFDTSQYPQGIRFVLAREGQAVPAGHAVVRSGYDRGIILDRRLAPTAEQFAIVDKARRVDRCGLFNQG